MNDRHQAAVIAAAAIALADAYRDHDSASGAIGEISNEFPDMKYSELLLIWQGVNACANRIKKYVTGE
jgi:hypothetical protein